MNERNKLLKKLSAAQFAAWEIHLFLDTHPNNEEALKSYRKYYKRYKELLAEYKMKFGCITAKPELATDEWEWINNPWPWDPQKGGEN